MVTGLIGMGVSFMAEQEIQKNIIDWINSLDKAKAINIHGGRFTESGTPDIDACIRGTPVKIEVKDPETSHGVTKIQAYRLEEWEETGCEVIVAEGVEDVKNHIDSDRF